MILRNSKIQQLFSSLLIVAVLLPSVTIFTTPKKAEAQFTDFVNAAIGVIGNVFTGSTAASNVSSISLQFKEIAKEIGRQLLMSVAKKALAEMTKSTVNWINTGYWGAPLFVSSPSTFFNDITKSQIKDFITITGYDNLRYPFGKQYALNLINQYKQQLSTNAEYSLYKATQNDPLLAEKLRIDFSTGGWDAFIMNTQYPQNNPFGYNLIASQELSQRLSGTIQSPADKINKLLEQGQGFLSPQACPSNPNYNDGHNEFNRPSFVYKAPSNLVEPDPYDYSSIGDYEDGLANPQYQTDYAKWDAANRTARDAAYQTWAAKNTCPGGLQTTTPGSVVANQITKSLGTTQTQKELAAALGNSLSAVFDSLLAKFMNPKGGLSSLASKTNSTDDGDNFSYYGQTLGSPTDAGTNGDWTTGPDELVEVSVFKREVSGGNVDVVDNDGTITQEYVPGAIELTALELSLISDDGKLPDGTTNSNAAGIMQILDKTWDVAMQLDICTPGPNKGWERRLDDERDRIINGKLVRETSAEGAGADLKIKAVNSVLRDLRFAVSSYKDWVETKMLASLPSSVLFIDAVKSIDENTQKETELTDKKREKTVVLARLKAIASQLAPFTTQPLSGSPEERNLILIRKQYNAIRNSIGNSVSVEDLRSQLDLAKSKLQNLRDLNAKCTTERTAAGWVGTPDVLGMNSYKPTLRGIQYFTKRKLPRPGSNYVASNAVPGPFSIPPEPLTDGKGTSGTELEQFCTLPTVSGYSHGEIVRPDNSNAAGTFKFTFINLMNDDGIKLSPEMDYTDLPLVKGDAIYGDSTGKFDPVYVDIECKTLFKVNIQDYKHAGDITF